MEKHFFCNKKLETPFGNIVCHGKMHLCAKYGHIIMNYAMENEAAKKWRKKIEHLMHRLLSVNHGRRGHVSTTFAECLTLPIVFSQFCRVSFFCRVYFTRLSA
jgi:hypothetical protein